ncbi:hypothetical protein ACFLX5_02260 [Chloroflexota bacterium]
MGDIEYILAGCANIDVCTQTLTSGVDPIFRGHRLIEGKGPVPAPGEKESTGETDLGTEMGRDGGRPGIGIILRDL